jgi:hypothetical protein
MASQIVAAPLVDLDTTQSARLRYQSPRAEVSAPDQANNDWSNSERAKAQILSEILRTLQFSGDSSRNSQELANYEAALTAFRERLGRADKEKTTRAQPRVLLERLSETLLRYRDEHPRN